MPTATTYPVPLYQTADGRWTFCDFLSSADSGPARILLVPAGSKVVDGLLRLPGGEIIAAVEAYDRGRTRQGGFGLGD